jgi:phenylalanyl-tRNA synthetase beta subunit
LLKQSSRENIPAEFSFFLETLCDAARNRTATSAVMDGATSMLVKKVGLMTLEVVWCNPLSLARTVRKVQRISRDEFRALYTVTDPITAHVLELISGKAA